MAKKAKTVVVEIPRPNIKETKVKIRGISPLIFHKWSEKAKKQIRDKQMKKASTGREVRKPKEEYKNSFYYNAKGEIAFPARCIKQAIVGAARSIEGVEMTKIRGAIFVRGDENGMIKVDYKKKQMREDMVRVGRGAADLRYRGQLDGWEMEFKVQFNSHMFSGEQVLNLIMTAGFSQGIGEWRPERNGDYGTFEVVFS